MDPEQLLAAYLPVASGAAALARTLIGCGGELGADSTGVPVHRVAAAVEAFVLARTRALGIAVRVVSPESGVVDIPARSDGAGGQSPGALDGGDRDTLSAPAAADAPDAPGAPGLVLLLAPADSVDLAARGYPLSAVALSLHRADSMAPLVAIVAEIATGRLLFASPRGAYSEDSRVVRPLRPAPTTRLADALVVADAATPSGLGELASQAELRAGVGLLLNYGGPLDIARVGAGPADAFVEIGVGVPAWEHAAGAYIAERAGATVTDLSGAPLVADPDPAVRCRFVAACTPELHASILAALRGEEPGD